MGIFRERTRGMTGPPVRVATVLEVILRHSRHEPNVSLRIDSPGFTHLCSGVVLFRSTPQKRVICRDVGTNTTAVVSDIGFAKIRSATWHVTSINIITIKFSKISDQHPAMESVLHCMRDRCILKYCNSLQYLPLFPILQSRL